MPHDEIKPALPLDADHVLDAVREPLLVLGADLRVLRANRSFYRAFGGSPQETVGKLVYALGDGQWDIPALRQLLEEIVPQNTAFDDFEVAHNFPTVGHKVMLLNARRVHRDDNPADSVLLAIEDVTERRRLEDERRDIVRWL
jgi:chemotaxis protein methyltransferase CheR